MEAREQEYLTQLGRTIQKQRKNQGITQQDMAALCNAEKANISRIESGKTNLTILTLRKIADALHISIAELFSLAKNNVL